MLYLQIFWDIHKIFGNSLSLERERNSWCMLALMCYCKTKAPWFHYEFHSWLEPLSILLKVFSAPFMVFFGALCGGLGGLVGLVGYGGGLSLWIWVSPSESYGFEMFSWRALDYIVSQYALILFLSFVRDL